MEYPFFCFAPHQLDVVVVIIKLNVHKLFKWIRSSELNKKKCRSTQNMCRLRLHRLHRLHRRQCNQLSLYNEQIKIWRAHQIRWLNKYNIEAKSDLLTPHSYNSIIDIGMFIIEHIAPIVQYSAVTLIHLLSSFGCKSIYMNIVCSLIRKNLPHTFAILYIFGRPIIIHQSECRLICMVAN